MKCSAGRSATVIGLLALVASSTTAQLPQTISYQGLLTSGGAAVRDSSYTLSFSLYSALTGGVPVWTESHPGVPVTGGTFSVILGSLTSLSGINLNQQLYLGVTRGSDPEFSPRTVLTSAPSSLAPWSANGNTLNYRNGNVGIGTDTVGSLFVVRGGSTWGVAEIVGNGTNAEGSISFRSSNVPKGGVGNWILGVNNNGGVSGQGVFSLYAANGLGAGSQLMSVFASGNVGIGTAIPQYKLDVGGIINATDIYKNGVPLPPGSQWGTNGSTISYLNGNVGIGTSTPTQQLEITGNLSLRQSTATSGIIYSNSVPFIHNFGIENFFAAAGAGNLSMSGASNTAVGYQSLSSNTTGHDNTATGAFALEANTTGTNNTANGYSALGMNTFGIFNTAFGADALGQTSGSYYNTALGSVAGANYDNGYNNVFVGAFTDVNGAGYYNVIAMGEGTVVTAPSTARFGNSATVSYGGWAGWTNVSDGRFKKNVRENVPGLEFITKLRPITYTFDATGMEAFLHRNDKHPLSPGAQEVQQKALREKEKIVYTGFVAQEVAAAAKDVGYDFSGVDAPKNESDYYGLRYAEFVVPLVKAIQEQQKMIDDLKKEVQELKRQK